jgi:hypothetical protein
MIWNTPLLREQKETKGTEVVVEVVLRYGFHRFSRI